MIRCAAKPYEGQEPYIFISYAHKDCPQVFAIIEQLTADGYRVWYDEGIHPGSEWPETIADRLNHCAVCLAFISPNSLASPNCRREINFAIQKEKCFISVVLEPSQMTPGMEMQLSTCQSIFKYQLPNDQVFFQKLYLATELTQCQGAVPPKKPPLEHFLYREKTGETIVINQNPFHLGRSPSTAHYVISDNAAISRCHASFTLQGEVCFVTDNGALNKTFRNHVPLPPNQPTPLTHGDIVTLYNENFLYGIR